MEQWLSDIVDANDDGTGVADIVERENAADDLEALLDAKARGDEPGEEPKPDVSLEAPPAPKTHLLDVILAEALPQIDSLCSELGLRDVSIGPRPCDHSSRYGCLIANKLVLGVCELHYASGLFDVRRVHHFCLCV